MKLKRLILTLAMVASATGVSAADWGTIKGRLVLEGTAPDPAKINVNKDPEYCGQHPLVDETIVAGENNGLPNVFVYLYTAQGAKLAIHPDLEKVTGPVTLDNKGCRFEPHALVVRTGQDLIIHSSDPIGHNTKVDLFKNASFNQTITSDTPLTKKFDKSEAWPLPVACSIHPWMKGVVLIRDNPYMVVTGKDGSFEIANIPVGAQQFIFWHESVGFIKNLKLGTAGKTDAKGRAKLKIAAGQTLDLGDIKVPVAALGH